MKASSCTTDNEDKESFPVKKQFPRIRLSKCFKKKFKQHHLVCEECGKQFRTWWDIREHWLSSAHKSPQQCRWCKKKTFTLQSHLCKHHWEVATSCPYCGQLFMFQEDQKRHLDSHDGSEYRCFLCGRRRKTEELLHSHMLNHYLYDKYGCNLCEKRFKKKNNLEKHLISIHFVCQYCGKNCEDEVDLKTHIKIHDDLVCLLCRKSFSQKNRLKYHYQLQHGHQDFYKCTLCFQRFSVKSRLINHLKLKHKGVSKFSCSVCAAPFLYWQQYVNHFEKVHAKVAESDQYKCSSCDFVTDMKIKLQWHVEKTSGDGFFCKKCQLRFPCKGMFDKHMETHTEEETVWNCDYCPRSYNSDNSLRHHISMYHKEMMISQNPRGYPCLQPDCDKYYATANSLSRHLRISHNKDSPSTSNNCSNTTTASPSPDLLDVESTTTVHRQGKKRVQEKARLVDSDVSENEKISDEEESSSSRKKFSEKESALTDKENETSTDETAEVIAKVSRKKRYLNREALKLSLMKSNSNSNSKNSEGISTGKTYHHMFKKPLEITEVDVYSCIECDKIWYTEESFLKEHLSKHKHILWEEECLLCHVSLVSPEDSVKHLVEEHLKVEFIL